MRLGTCATASLIALGLLIIILIGASVHTVPYNKYAFTKDRISGKISRDKVYKSGRYMLTPAEFFVTYPSKTQVQYLVNLNAWSRAGADDAGTQLYIDVSFVYRLIPEELPLLYEKVGLRFDQFMSTISTNAIKNNATTFSADDFLTKRRFVEESFFQSVRDVVREKVNSEVISLQLLHVSFPEKYYSRKLAAGIQIQNNAKEEYKKTASVIRGETDERVKFIQNDADEVIGRAKADVNLIIKKAQNSQVLQQGLPRIVGLQTMASELSVTNTADLMSMDYMIGLAKTDTANTRLMVNFRDVPEAKQFTPST